MNGQDDVDSVCLPGPPTTVQGVLGVLAGVHRQFSEASQAWSYQGMKLLAWISQVEAANSPNTELVMATSR
jgi:hypothetical protein